MQSNVTHNNFQEVYDTYYEYLKSNTFIDSTKPDTNDAKDEKYNDNNDATPDSYVRIIQSVSRSPVKTLNELDVNTVNQLRANILDKYITPDERAGLMSRNSLFLNRLMSPTANSGLKSISDPKTLHSKMNASFYDKFI